MANRIVSLTPSITETLFALGAGARVVGVTDACDYPPEANERPHVCSWVDPDMERIGELNPDLVLGLETAHRHLRTAFESAGIRLELFNPVCVADAFMDIRRVGALLDLDGTAQSLVGTLQSRMEKLAERVRAGAFTPAHDSIPRAGHR